MRRVSCSGEAASSCVGQSVRVYVGGLPVDVLDEEVRSGFSGVGEVLEVSVARHEQGGCKGYASVTFPDRVTAERGCSMIKTVRPRLVSAASERCGGRRGACRPT